MQTAARNAKETTKGGRERDRDRERVRRGQRPLKSIVDYLS